MKDEIIKEIKENITGILVNMSSTKYLDEINKQKTLSDSLSLLINMFMKNAEKNTVLKGNIPFSYYYDINTILFFEKVAELIKAEVTRLGDAMKHFMSQQKHKEYRDALIAYDKLTSSYDRLSSEIDHSKDIANKHDIN